MSSLCGRGFLAELFEIFSTTTAIRGFAFIKQSQCRCERSLWITIVIIFTVMTIYDVTNTIATFVAQPTSSTFRILKNGTITLQDPTVCLELDVPSLSLSLNISNKIEVAKFLNSYVQVDDIVEFLRKSNPYDEQLIKPTIDDFVYKSSSAYDTSTKNSSLMTLISLTTMMLTNMIRADQAISNRLGPETLKWGLLNSSTPESSRNSIAMVNRFYTEKNVSFYSLMKTICSLLCRQMNFKVFVHRSAVEDSTAYIHYPCSEEECFWLGMFGPAQINVLCVIASDRKAFEFSRPMDSNTISFDATPAYKLPFHVHFFLIDFKGNFGNKNLDLLLLSYGKQKSVMVQIDGYFKALNLARNPCGHETFFSCSTKCKNDFTSKWCGCTPLSDFNLRKASRESAICGAERDKNPNDLYIYNSSNPDCRNMSLRGITAQFCNSKCPEDCETQLISYSFQESLTSFAIWQNLTYLQMGVRKYAFPYVVEYETLGLKELVARFGGNLSLYLGASFIALIHIMLFLAKVPLEYSKYKRKYRLVVDDRRKIEKEPDEVRFQNLGYIPQHIKLK